MRQKTQAGLITIGAALVVGALYSSVAISQPIQRQMHKRCDGQAQRTLSCSRAPLGCRRLSTFSDVASSGRID